jgi:signal transduction histidine kinase
VALYRVVCELINNTLKHASAAKIMIKLVKDEKQIEVRYSDNGIGCDVQKMLSSPSKGLGLSNIISRVKSINGNCTFSSEPGHHFTSVISVAIADESEKDNPQNPEKS